MSARPLQLQGLVETGRGNVSRRVIIVLVALGIHGVALGGVLAHNALDVPPIEPPPLRVELKAIIASPPPPPPPPPTPRSQAIPEPVEVVPSSPPLEIEELPPETIVEPSEIPGEIDLTPLPSLPAPRDSVSVASDGIGDGVEGGIGGGILDGVPAPPIVPTEPIREPEVWAKLIDELMPKYPRRARISGLEGTVVLEAIIRRDGTVGDINVLKELGMGCTKAAIDAVRKRRYEPARQNGAVVAQILEIEIVFQLQ